MEKELTSKEKLFCYHYLMLGNAKEAAIAAGFPIRNAHTKAAKLLSRGKIREFLNLQYDSLAKRKVSLIMSGLERLAFGGINDAVTLAFSDEISEDRISKLDLFNVAEIKRPKSGAEEIKIAGDNLAYSDLVNFWSKFEDMNLTTLLASPNNMSRILQFAEIRDNFGGDYMTSGKIKLPFGATLIKTTCLDDSKIIGLDKSCALEMVIAQDLSLESDKLIDRQLERTAITTVAGFSKIFNDASKVLSLA